MLASTVSHGSARQRTPVRAYGSRPISAGALGEGRSKRGMSAASRMMALRGVTSKVAPSLIRVRVAPSQATRRRSRGRSTLGSALRTVFRALRICAGEKPRSTNSLAARTVTKSWKVKSWRAPRRREGPTKPDCDQ